MHKLNKSPVQCMSVPGRKSPTRSKYRYYEQTMQVITPKNPKIDFFSVFSALKDIWAFGMFLGCLDGLEGCRPLLWVGLTR